jgi:outer membrane protein assembly factor BamB
MNGPVHGPIGVRPRTPLLALPLAALALAACLAAGCAGDQSGSTSTASPAAVPDTKFDLEKELLIGPSKAMELGYRIDHQVRTFPEGDSGVKLIEISGDSAFALDGLNFLTRIRRADGTRLWRIPVADPLDEIYGIVYLPAQRSVMLLVSGYVTVHDRDTGSLLDKQKLDHMAATAPVVIDPVIMYGSRNGQLVWHSFEVGYQWKAYQVSSAIRLAPVVLGREVAVVSTDGVVMVIDIGSGAGIWEKRLLAGVDAEPVAGDGLLYLAGLDQYVWALDTGSGRTAWRYLSEAPLQSAPALIGDRLYQHIPTEGLVSFVAAPIDTPGGEIVWKAPDVRGSVIGARDHLLLVWDHDARELAVVEADRGAVKTTVDLPDVRHLEMSEMDLYAAGDDGRVIRLVPSD